MDRRSFLSTLAAAAMPTSSVSPQITGVRELDGADVIERGIAQAGKRGLVELDATRDEGYVLTRTLLIEGAHGLKIKGKSRGGTRLTWRGANPGAPAILWRNGFQTGLEDLHVLVSEPCSDVVRIEKAYGPEGGPNASQQSWERLSIGIRERGAFQNGFRYARGAQGDVNNEWGTFRQCEVSGARDASFAIEHSNSLAHSFYDCLGQGGKYNVRCSSGSFSAFGHRGNSCSEADFYVGDLGVVNITGGDFEHSRRLFVASDMAGLAPGGQCPVSIRGVRWVGDGMDPRDRVVIDAQNPGPFTLEASYIGANARPIIRVGSKTKQPSAFVCRGVAFGRSVDFELSKTCPMDADIKGNVYGTTPARFI